MPRGRRRETPGNRARAAALALAAASLAASAEPAAAASPLSEPQIPPLATDRVYQVLDPAVDARARLADAAGRLGDWRIDLAGTAVDGPRLAAIAESPEPLLRAAREELGRAVDLPDLLLFLDDALASGRRGERFFVPPGRARKAGILVHPADVFGESPDRRPAGRRYGDGEPPSRLAVDRPRPQRDLAPARDGEPLGPRWTRRFLNPSGEEAMLQALSRARPGRDFAPRIRALLDQLRAQGAQVSLGSTTRSRHRGYLMWGAFELSRAGDRAAVEHWVAALDARNRSWGLAIPIRWAHPEGWERTRASAREMADTYQVVFATEAGARASQHYDGEAVDLSAVALPRRLVLEGADGARAEFDLSHPRQTRDLSLSPPLIEWIETHFGLEKLRLDYPHWSDDPDWVSRGGGSAQVGEAGSARGVAPR